MSRVEERKQASPVAVIARDNIPRHRLCVCVKLNTCFLARSCSSVFSLSVDIERDRKMQMYVRVNANNFCKILYSTQEMVRQVDLLEMDTNGHNAINYDAGNTVEIFGRCASEADHFRLDCMT
nr:hypothetical protein CFP56_24008 [Quercus suber]